MLNTPGDVGDKLIAGTTDLAGSAGTGLLLQHHLVKSLLGACIDQVGSIAGCTAVYVGDQMQSGKDSLMGGEGLSAYERANVEYEDQLTQQLIQDLDSAGLTDTCRSSHAN